MSVRDLSKKVRWQSPKYREAANEQSCTMRLHGICNGNTETTVLAHKNGGGMGAKESDYNAADMCSACHDVYDGRVKTFYQEHEIEACFERARYETIVNRIERGILK